MKDLKFCERNEKEKAENAAICFAICSGCIGTRMVKFSSFSLAGPMPNLRMLNTLT